MSLAVPVKDGVVVLDGDAGGVKVTVGAGEAAGLATAGEAAAPHHAANGYA